MANIGAFMNTIEGRYETRSRLDSFRRALANTSLNNVFSQSLPAFRSTSVLNLEILLPSNRGYDKSESLNLLSKQSLSDFWLKPLVAFPWILIPADCRKPVYQSAYRWNPQTEPDPEIESEKCSWPRSLLFWKFRRNTIKTAANTRQLIEKQPDAFWAVRLFLFRKRISAGLSLPIFRGSDFHFVKNIGLLLLRAFFKTGCGWCGTSFDKSHKLNP